MNFIRHCPAALPFILLLGCAAPHARLEDTSPVAPAHWRHHSAPSAAGSISEWWKAFGSNELTDLVRQAEERNPDIAAGLARIRQSEAGGAMVRAGLFPVVSASMDSTRNGNLRDFPDNTGGARYGAAFSASYEVDLWGRNRAVHASSLHALKASIYDLDTVRLTTVAGAASLWLQTVSAKERISFAELNLGSSLRVLSIVQARADAGAATSLELAQQRGLVASQEQSLLALRQQANDAHTALALLLGQPVAEFSVKTKSLSDLRISTPDAGVPSALLTQRPDIAQAEAQLMAAEADISAARAAMLPGLTLTGGLNSGGSRYSSILNDPLHSVAAGLAAPIFDAGRLSAGKRLAEARREELLTSYRKVILSAFSDVETALNAVAGLAAQAEAQSKVQEQAARAFRIAEVRYRFGAETLITLLDAQRTLYASQDDSVRIRLARLLASVSLYKALGGGWRA